MQLPRQRRGVAWLALTPNRRQTGQKLLWQRLFKLLATCMLSRHVHDLLHAVRMTRPHEYSADHMEPSLINACGISFHKSKSGQRDCTSNSAHSHGGLVDSSQFSSCVCWSAWSGLKVIAQLPVQQQSVFDGRCHIQLPSRLTSKPHQTVAEVDAHGRCSSARQLLTGAGAAGACHACRAGQ